MTAIEPGADLCEGRYRIERLLGTGGMAAVWFAHDRRLNRPVAIKVISDTLAADPQFVHRFEREARIAAGLSHPNLVRVYDYGDHEGRPLLIMEYLPGTLSELLRRRGPAAIDSEDLARDLLGALSEVHSAGIVHRDVKPANVLLDEEGRARLTDFGIARSDDATQLTQTGVVIGTAAYLAPEVALGAPAGVGSDLYSLGVLLSECAGGRLSPSLDALITRLTAPEPDDRPRSAAAALADLQAIDQPEGETQVRTATAVAPVREVRAGRRPPRPAVLIGVALVTIAVIAGLRAGDTDQPGSRVDPALERRLDAMEREVRAAVR